MKFNLEGIDGSGKTTLANKLVLDDKESILHSTQYTPNTFDWHKSEMLNDDYYVFDRFFIGEWVWSKVYERWCKLSNDEIQWLIDNFPGVHIYCFNNKWKEVLIARGEENQIPEKELALKYYEEFFKQFDFSQSILLRYNIDVL